jgi:hypothetical protein
MRASPNTAPLSSSLGARTRTGRGARVAARPRELAAGLHEQIVALDVAAEVSVRPSAPVPLVVALAS